MSYLRIAFDQHYQAIIKNIKEAAHSSRRELSDITLVAVSKGQGADAIESLYRLGQRHFGENYLHEYLEKKKELDRRGCLDIHWHFIGHLQTNKVKSLLSHPLQALHTLDSRKLAETVIKRLPEGEGTRKLCVFIEVNIAGEETKAGLSPKDVPEFAKYVASLDQLDLKGLMCIPPQEQDPKHWFSQLRELEKDCRPYTQGGLSMGMSSDFELAIREGSTHVRIGTALFGPRVR